MTSGLPGDPSAAEDDEGSPRSSRLAAYCFRTCFAAGDFSADRGGDDRAEEHDRAHDVVMGHGADADLKQEALVVEELVLVEDFLYRLLGTAGEVCTFQGRFDQSAL